MPSFLNLVPVRLWDKSSTACLSGKFSVRFLPKPLSGMFRDVLHFLFPCYCWQCGRRLLSGENHLCTECLAGLPRTGYHRQPGNSMEQRFWGQIPIRQATAFFFYHKDGAGSILMYQLKYYGHPGVGEYLARCAAREMLADAVQSSFFEGIDYVLPLPLHPKKKRRRGYNQCDYIARGISSVTGIPVRDDVVFRRVANASQTRKSRAERRENVEGIFSLRSGKGQKGTPSLEKAWAGKHLLIVDDVCTTGATITAMAEALMVIPGVQISVFTLALAGQESP